MEKQLHIVCGSNCHTPVGDCYIDENSAHHTLQRMFVIWKTPINVNMFHPSLTFNKHIHKYDRYMNNISNPVSLNYDGRRSYIGQAIDRKRFT